MVTFKEGCSKLYYTQHTLLSNVRQLPISLSLVCVRVCFSQKRKKKEKEKEKEKEKKE